MFVSDSVRLDSGIGYARARLADLVRDGREIPGAAQQAYAGEADAVVQAGPVPGVSRLVAVQFRDLVTRGDQTVLTLRWEAAGPGGGLFPALDADITLAPDGDGAVLTLDGSYRPPLGALGATLDRAVLHHVAAATVRAFLNRLAEAIISPETLPATDPSLAGLQPLWLPVSREAR